MKLLGSTYVSECVLINKGLYAIADKYNAIDRGSYIHVSLQTALSGYGFVIPRIKKDGGLIPIDMEMLDSLIRGRYTVYSSLDDIFVIVSINGDYIKDTQSWSDDTRVEFFVPVGIVSGFDLNSPTKGVLSFTKNFQIASTKCSSLLIGRSNIKFNSPVNLEDAVLSAISPFISSRLNFYTGRIVGSL